MAAARKLKGDPRIPPGLGPDGLAFFTGVLEQYEVEAVDQLAVLTQAAKACDMVARLQRFVDESEELRSLGSMRQATALPELVELRQWQKQFAALVKQLGCETEQDAVVREREPGVKLTASEAGKLGASIRWGKVSR